MAGVFAVALAALVAPAAAATPSADTFGVDPAPGSPVENGYFSLRLSPGGQASQAIRVSNETGHDADVRLAAVDATTAQKGGVAYGATGSTPTADGAWIILDKTEIKLPAGTRQDVTFRVSVPKAARPGVHLAGIIAYGPQTRTPQTLKGGGGAGAALFIESRRALAVQVTLPGPAEPGLVVSGVTTKALPNGLNLVVDISNDGTGLAKGRGHLDVSGPSSFSADFDIDTVVPATSLAYPVVWTKTPVSGTYRVKAVIAYGEQRQEWEGNVVVGQAEQADLQNRVVAGGHTPATAEGGGVRPGQRTGAGVTLVAVFVVAVFVVVGLLVPVLVVFARLRRRRSTVTQPPA